MVKSGTVQSAAVKQPVVSEIKGAAVAGEGVKVVGADTWTPAVHTCLGGRGNIPRHANDAVDQSKCLDIPEVIADHVVWWKQHVLANRYSEWRYSQADRKW